MQPDRHRYPADKQRQLNTRHLIDRVAGQIVVRIDVSIRGTRRVLEHK